ncbi:hypothetical protein LCGC14_3153040, partial [marine sediment metagenome]
WILVFVVIIVESAIAALAFVGSSIETGLPVERFGHVILLTAKNHLPIAVGALILSAAVAIVVSTADSFLLVSANSFVRDVYHRFVHPQASGRTLVFASRLAVVFLGLAAFCASVFATKFLSVALWAYTVYGAAITPALLAAFFWKRATGAGAACAIAGATITTIGWKLSIQKNG